MKRHIYISACSPDGGIYHYIQNGDGSLDLKDILKLDRPMYHIIKDGAMHILLREPFENSKDSGLIKFKIEKDGTLSSPSPILSSHGVVACHLCSSGDSDYCVNYVSGSVLKFPDRLVTHFGDGPNKPRQDKAHAHFVGESPDGKYIFVCDLGLDTVFVYDKNLNEISRAKVPAGHGARHIVCSDDGKTVFVANELASTVSAFDYSDGHLSLVCTESGLPSSFTGNNTMAAIRIREGLIYASNRGHNSISCFSYENRCLSLVSVTNVGGEGPRDFDFIGDYVYVTNEQTNNITVLRNENGKLALLPFAYSAPDPLCVCSAEF
ncbi:MAG: beta-propeller fold lactonase family protein [Eubacteriales bacterium]